MASFWWKSPPGRIGQELELAPSRHLSSRPWKFDPSWRTGARISFRFLRETVPRTISRSSFALLTPPGRNRTYDRLLKRELLYRLSYGRERAPCESSLSRCARDPSARMCGRMAKTIAFSPFLARLQRQVDRRVEGIAADR